MADIDQLKTQFDEAHEEANKHRTNIQREKLQISLELAEAHAKMDMARATLKYADAALNVDVNQVRAHMLKARALEGMGNKKRGAARKAADLGLEACDRVACLEGLSDLRAEFRAMQERLPPVVSKEKNTVDTAAGTQLKKATPEGAPSPPVPKTEKPSLKASHQLSVPPPAPPPSAAPAAALRPKSVWNSKDTWEEVDVTDWAVDALAARVEGTVCTLCERTAAAAGPPSTVRGSVTLTAVRSAGGHAQVVYFQRKRRTLFDLSFDLHWQADLVVVVDTPPSPTPAEEEPSPSRLQDPTALKHTNEKQYRLKGFVSLGDVVQDLDDPSDLVLVSVPFKEDEEAGNPARSALKRWIESPASGGESVQSPAAAAAAAANGETSITSHVAAGVGYVSLRAAVLACAKAFEADFKALGSESNDNQSSRVGAKVAPKVASRRSLRRRDEAAEASARESELAAANRTAAQEAARASAVEDLKQSNPHCKVSI
eukprot:CAMPEP_0171708428 /NCGR_PEP_ID=MMETSP0991-20121206/14931_1 /TAXON_ID=483369 /ORGANISM="non described non described, Strain CCMP2098" /LENGTH=486 /DNA_ID=CAMNT_0012298451 /DNA_START=74 /DNA_END=1534 /DNA_ORIENTATION=-